MNKGIELANYGASGYCILNIKTNEITFMQKPLSKEFTGLYFKDNTTFFAIYPTSTGPKIYYNNKEYSINKSLGITLQKINKNRRFIIEDYGIEIAYNESPFIGMDEWSEEIDVDLFFMIEQRYKEQSFYDRYTLK